MTTSIAAKPYMDVPFLDRLFRHYQTWRELLISGEMGPDITLPDGTSINFFDIEVTLQSLSPNHQNALIQVCFKDQRTLSVGQGLIDMKNRALKEVLKQLLGVGTPTLMEMTVLKLRSISPIHHDPDLPVSNPDDLCTASGCQKPRAGKNRQCWAHMKSAARRRAAERTYERKNHG